MPEEAQASLTTTTQPVTTARKDAASRQPWQCRFMAAGSRAALTWLSSPPPEIKGSGWYSAGHRRGHTGADTALPPPHKRVTGVPGQHGHAGLWASLVSTALRERSGTALPLPAKGQGSPPPHISARHVEAPPRSHGLTASATSARHSWDVAEGKGRVLHPHSAGQEHLQASWFFQS